MKTRFRVVLWAVIGLVFASGCSVFPGLKALSNQAGADAAAESVVQTTSLIMGDKTGLTDPALNAVADRIEAANNKNVDIIEIRKNLNTDVFSVYMLLRPESQNMTNADFFNQERRAIELTWQATLDQSQGSNTLKVVLLGLRAFPTLDRGIGFLGVIDFTVEISRTDALVYLNHRPNTINDFLDLIAQGKMIATRPTDMEIYDGTPNHSIFMLSELKAQSQQSG